MTDPRRRCPGDLPVVALAAAARTALWTALMLAAWCLVPAVLGWHVTTVGSDSMAPSVRAGDVVAAAPVAGDDVVPGQVLLVDDPDHDGRLRLHRLERIDDAGLRLRGDANAATDSTPVDPAAVHGVGALRVPWVGVPGLWARTGQVAPLALLSLAAGVAVVLTRLDRDTRLGLPCRGCGRPRWEVGSPAPGADDVDRRAGLTRTTAAVTVLSLALVSSAPSSGAVFSAPTHASGSASTSTFPGCFAGPQLDSPVLAWDFGEPRGTTVLDVSGHGQTGTMLDDPRRNDGPCPDNPSLHVDDTDGRVQSQVVASAPSTFSVEIWFRTTHVGGRLIGFSSSTAPASPFKDRHLYIDSDGRLRFGVQGSSGWRFAVVSTTGVADGRWHHAVGSFRPGALDLYLDGEKQAGRSDAATLQSYEGSWRVSRESLDGWPFQPASFRFVGDLDTARVYATALDAAAVRQHFAAGR